MYFIAIFHDNPENNGVRLATYISLFPKCILSHAVVRFAHDFSMKLNRLLLLVILCTV